MIFGKTSFGNYKDIRTSFYIGPFNDGGLITAVTKDKQFESIIRFGELERKGSGYDELKGTPSVFGKTIKEERLSL